MNGQGTKGRRNIAQNFNRLSRAHERYRQTDRQTDGRAIANAVPKFIYNNPQQIRSGGV